MNDIEISKALALAIGWNGNLVRNIGSAVIIYTKLTGWRTFDYRDWNVIGPIAERYNCFPVKDMYRRWVAGVYPYTYTDTPQKAIALAVIHGEKK